LNVYMLKVCVCVCVCVCVFMKLDFTLINASQALA
jgi:hypothetical protein